MKPRCPLCTSPDIHPTGTRGSAYWRCGKCGARVHRGRLLVALDEVEAAREELRKGGDVIGAVNRFSDPDELHDLVVSALDEGIIEADRPYAYLRIAPTSLETARPLLIVEPGPPAPALFGGELDLGSDDVEDPVDFTLRFLAAVVDRANEVSSRMVAAISTDPALASTGEPRRGRIGARPRGRRFFALALPRKADGRSGDPLATATALSVTGALVEIGEQLEDRVLGTEVEAIDVALDWHDRDEHPGRV